MRRTPPEYSSFGSALPGFLNDSVHLRNNHAEGSILGLPGKATLNRSRGKPSEGFDRPFGTFATGTLDPAVNCRAILKSPYGRWEARAQNVQTPVGGHEPPLQPHGAFWNGLQSASCHAFAAIHGTHPAVRPKSSQFARGSCYTSRVTSRNLALEP